MEIQSIKSELHEIIDQANDLKVLEAVRTLLRSSAKEQDFWDQLPDFQKESIERGLEQAENGQTTPYKDVMKKYEKWLSK
jgi:predicted transcriptional regulator